MNLYDKGHEAGINWTNQTVLDTIQQILKTHGEEYAQGFVDALNELVDGNVELEIEELDSAT